MGQQVAHTLDGVDAADRKAPRASAETTSNNSRRRNGKHRPKAADNEWRAMTYANGLFVAEASSGSATGQTGTPG